MKSFRIVYFPNVILPENLPTEAELQNMVRPLNLCPICNYMLCSCGNCHNSQLCNEVCKKEQKAING